MLVYRVRRIENKTGKTSFEGNGKRIYQRLCAAKDAVDSMNTYRNYNGKYRYDLVQFELVEGIVVYEHS